MIVTGMFNLMLSIFILWHLHLHFYSNGHPNLCPFSRVTTHNPDKELYIYIIFKKKILLNQPKGSVLLKGKKIILNIDTQILEGQISHKGLWEMPIASLGMVTFLLLTSILRKCIKCSHLRSLVNKLLKQYFMTKPQPNYTIWYPIQVGPRTIQGEDMITKLTKGSD